MSPTRTVERVLLVDPESVGAPTRFIARLLESDDARDWRIETDPGRLGTAFAVVAYVDDAVAEALASRRAPFALMITPQESFRALTGELARRASRVVRIGHNRTVRPQLRHATVLDGVCPSHLSAAPGATEAAREPASDAPLNLIHPESYLWVWEQWIAARSVPRAVRVLADRRSLPPPWFAHEIRERGSDFELFVDRPTERARFLALDGVLARDNRAVDAIDLDLIRVGAQVLPLRREPLAPSGLVPWARVLSAATTDEPPVQPARVSAAPGGPMNIVCYNPTYLFADLVKRFERAGCVHSEFPMRDAGSYIWLRPQELAAFADLTRQDETIDVPRTYVSRFLDDHEEEGARRYDVQGIERRSVAIHHGTCFEPIVQFDAYRLAQRLAPVNRVAGVCELEECYGPSYPQANPHNYEFVPIGYDHTLYTEAKVRRAKRPAKGRLTIGFVGRAYGTEDRKKLDASRLAHPKGYRKGGDHLVGILLRLQARGVDFELHLVGNNWEEHVAELESYGVSVVYYTRDKNITYQDYPEVFAGFDVLLIAARAEGGPVSAIEAMSVGAPVVGTDVGIVPYLAKTTDHCWTYHYDTRWHRLDFRGAVEHLVRLWERPFTHEDRLACRRSVRAHTTDRWVERCCELARKSVPA